MQWARYANLTHLPQSKGLSALDVVNAISLQNLILSGVYFPPLLGASLAYQALEGTFGTRLDMRVKSQNSLVAALQSLPLDAAGWFLRAS